MNADAQTPESAPGASINISIILREVHAAPSGTPSQCEDNAIIPVDHILDRPDTPQLQRRIWDMVSHSPLRSLWNLEGIPVRVIVKHTWRATLDDNLVGRAAELGFYFIFALFPSLFTATSILGLAARSASKIYYSLLGYLSIVIPHAAMGTVLDTFNQTTAATTGGKLTFGLMFAIWSASVGFSAIQDALNVVYKIKESRSYLAARLSAIGVTILLLVLVTSMLLCLLGGDFFARMAELRLANHVLALTAAVVVRGISWSLAALLLSLFFAAIYYFAPDKKRTQWHWLTPGALVGILGWLIASIGLRIYVREFGDYSVTYGSLGAVIILLTWFYLSGLMLLVGAEINSEIEASAAAKHLIATEQVKLSVTPTPGDTIDFTTSISTEAAHDLSGDPAAPRRAESQGNPHAGPKTAA